MKNLFLLFCLLMGTFSFAQEASSLIKVMTTDQCAMQYPSNWQIAQNSEMNGGFFLFSPEEKNDSFRENINLVVEEHPHGFTLKKFAQENVAKLTASLEDFKIIESQMKLINNQPVYYMKYSGKLGFLDLVWEQYVFPKNGKVYTLTGVMEVSKTKKYSSVFNEMLESFSFIK